MGPPSVAGDAAPIDAEARTARKRAERVAGIIGTAARLYAQRGYDNTNFDDIAAELDMRGPSLYYYFSSKEELFKACLNTASEQVFVRLRAIVDAQSEPIEVLRQLIREQVIIELRDFPEFVPLFYGKHVAVPSLREEGLRLRRLHADIFEGAARRYADGLVDPARLRAWLGVAYGAFAYLPEWYKPDGGIDDTGMAELISETLMSALQAAAAASSLR